MVKNPRAFWKKARNKLRLRYKHRPSLELSAPFVRPLFAPRGSIGKRYSVCTFHTRLKAVSCTTDPRYSEFGGYRWYISLFLRRICSSVRVLGQTWIEACLRLNATEPGFFRNKSRSLTGNRFRRRHCQSSLQLLRSSVLSFLFSFNDIEFFNARNNYRPSKGIRFGSSSRAARSIMASFEGIVPGKLISREKYGARNSRDGN